jgi:hypothetical protein
LCRAVVAFASAALVFTVAAQYTQTKAVRAYPSAFRGATTDSGAAIASVHFKTVQSELIDVKVDKWYPSGGLFESSQRHSIFGDIRGHNYSWTNLSRESESTAKNSSQHDDSTSRLSEQTLTILADVLHMLIKAVFFANQAPLLLIASAAAVGGIVIGCFLSSAMMHNDLRGTNTLKIPPA